MVALPFWIHTMAFTEFFIELFNFFASLLELNSALASTRPCWMSLAVIHLWSRSNVGFWMIPFIPWRDYFLFHSPLTALYISSLLLHNFSLPARWVTFSPSLFRHSHFLYIHVYVGFFNASSILSLTAAFSYKWLSLDSNRKENPFLFLGQPPSFSLQSAVQPPVPFCWSWVNCGTEYGETEFQSLKFTWTVYILWISPSQLTVSE